MYRETSSATRTRRRTSRIVGLVLAIALVIAAWFTFSSVDASLREQGAVSVRNAIMDSAKQCCAIEGSYPVSLDYLESKYGLRVNRDDYVITYEVFAENILPSVVVVPR